MAPSSSFLPRGIACILVSETEINERVQKLAAEIITSLPEGAESVLVLSILSGYDACERALSLARSNGRDEWSVHIHTHYIYIYTRTGVMLTDVNALTQCVCIPHVCRSFVFTADLVRALHGVQSGGGGAYISIETDFMRCQSYEGDTRGEIRLGDMGKRGIDTMRCVCVQHTYDAVAMYLSPRIDDGDCDDACTDDTRSRVRVDVCVVVLASSVRVHGCASQWEARAHCR